MSKNELRKAIKDSGKTLFQVSIESKVSIRTLQRFLNGHTELMAKSESALLRWIDSQ